MLRLKVTEGLSSSKWVPHYMARFKPARLWLSGKKGASTVTAETAGLLG